MSTATLIQHIRSLIVADPSLASLNLGLVNYGIPSKLPAVYLDAIVDVDDKLNCQTFNLCFVTNDLSIEQFDVAQRIKLAIQQSHCIQAQGLLPRPEPENKRNRWIIPCRFYPNHI